MALSSSCISRTELRALATSVLASAATDAGDKVFDPDTLPADLDDLPMLIVSAPSERKETSGEGAPQFATTIMLAVMARAQGKQEGLAEQALDRLLGQAERALLCTPAMIAPIQRFTFVETHAVINSNGKTFLGEATLIIGCEVQQLYEPDAGAPLTEMVISTGIPPAQGPVFRSFLQTPSP